MIMQQWHAATTTRHSYTLTYQFLTDLQTFELLRDIQFGLPAILIGASAASPTLVVKTENCLYICIYRSVPQIHPPFCNLSLSTKRRGGLYAGCDIFSRDYALPSGAPPITSCPKRTHLTTLQLPSGMMLFIHVAVPCRNRRLFRLVF